jgi:hypothetical protein
MSTNQAIKTTIFKDEISVLRNVIIQSNNFHNQIITSSLNADETFLFREVTIQSNNL